MIVVVKQAQDQWLLQVIYQQEKALVPSRISARRHNFRIGKLGNTCHSRALLVMSLAEGFAVIDTDLDVWVGGPSTKLDTLYTARGTDLNMDDTDSRVERCAREHLLKIKGEYIGLIHHGLQDAMDGVANEARQAGNLRIEDLVLVDVTYKGPYVADIEPESVTTDRLQHIVKHRLLREAEINKLHMREVGH